MYLFALVFISICFAIALIGIGVTLWDSFQIAESITRWQNDDYED